MHPVSAVEQGVKPPHCTRRGWFGIAEWGLVCAYVCTIREISATSFVAVVS